MIKKVIAQAEFLRKAVNVEGNPCYLDISVTKALKDS